LTAVSVIIATRDRPGELRRAVASVLANTHPDFELIVADQGATGEAAGYLEGLAAADPRVRPLRPRAAGKARAVNAALARAAGAVLAFTDDDCEVPTTWLGRATAVLAAEPGAGIVFGALAAAPHDPRAAHVPVFLPPRRRRLRGRFAPAHWSGAGANMAVRRAVFERVGPFDGRIGPGGCFRSGDDRDLAYRALRAGFAVVQDPDNVVVHWGARAIASGAARRTLTNNFFGLGANYAAHARRGDAVALAWLVAEAARTGANVALNAARGHRPWGVRCLAALARGALHGLRCPGEATCAG
jgi:glycosyltransferase involved in cell wall biosynthesis